MNGNDLILWIRQFLFSSLDFVIMYLIAHTLMRKYIEVKKQHVLFAIIFTILTSMGFYFFDGWSARIIHHLLWMLMFKKIIKRADWIDMLIIFFVSLVTVGIIQGTLLIIAGLFFLDRSIAYPVMQILTTVSIFGVCKLFKWYRLFHAIRSNLLLKLISATLALVFVVMMSILNFEFELSYIFFSIVAVILLSVVSSPLFIRIYQKVNGIISLDDLKTDLFTTAIDMIEESDVKEMYQVYAELAKQYGVDVSSFPEDKRKFDEENASLEQAKTKILQLVQRKVEDSGKVLEIDSTILYYEEYDEINLECVIDWVGSLVEQLLRTATGNPIYIYLFSMSDSFRLEVAGQCVIEKWELVEKMFKQNIPSENNENSSRLQELYKSVIELDGKFLVKPSYVSEYACHYLQISIELEKEGIS